MIDVEAPITKLSEPCCQAVQVAERRVALVIDPRALPEHDVRAVIWDNFRKKVAVDLGHVVCAQIIIHGTAFHWQRTTKHAIQEASKLPLAACLRARGFC
jgi:hypothetical protein